jgi:AcrR family transcriptional regulator
VVTAEDYFREAFAVLGDYGSDGLTIALLGDRLGVTKGSFYHHFGGMPGFVDQLLAYWTHHEGSRLTALARSQRDPAVRLAGWIDYAVDLPHACEAAIRAWGRSNPVVAESVAQVDKRRERYVTDAVAALGFDRAAARVLARIVLNVLAGVQQREQPVDRRRLREMFEAITAG